MGTGDTPGRLHALKRGNSMTSKSLWMSIAVAPQAIPLQGDGAM
jgi:hypothetical protein